MNHIRNYIIQIHQRIIIRNWRPQIIIIIRIIPRIWGAFKEKLKIVCFNMKSNMNMNKIVKNNNIQRDDDLQNKQE